MATNMALPRVLWLAHGSLAMPQLPRASCRTSHDTGHRFLSLVPGSLGVSLGPGMLFTQCVDALSAVVDM